MKNETVRGRATLKKIMNRLSKAHPTRIDQVTDRDLAPILVNDLVAAIKPVGQMPPEVRIDEQGTLLVSLDVLQLLRQPELSPHDAEAVAALQRDIGFCWSVLRVISSAMLQRPRYRTGRICAWTEGTGYKLDPSTVRQHLADAHAFKPGSDPRSRLSNRKVALTRRLHSLWRIIWAVAKVGFGVPLIVERRTALPQRLITLCEKNDLDVRAVHDLLQETAEFMDEMHQSLTAR